MQLKLVFSRSNEWELIEILFKSDLYSPKVSRRGKTLVYKDDDGCFQWTRAVKAFCLLAVGSKLSPRKGAPFFLQGLAGSHAASLDFAISKPTQWIADIFIDTKADIDQRRRVFKITNSERKLPGPTQVQLANSLFDDNALEVTDEKDLALSDDSLKQIYIQLEEQFKIVPSEKLVSETNNTAVAEDLSWNNSAGFLRQQSLSAHQAFQEVELHEPLGVTLAQERLKNVFPSTEVFDGIFQELLNFIPDSNTRYKNIEPRFENCDQPIRIGAPPTAVAALMLLRQVAKKYKLPIEVYSHHNSSSSVIANLDDGQLDLVILSWGAVSKLLHHPLDIDPQALLILPRTGIDFIASEAANPLEQLKVYLATEKAGYPNQFYEVLTKKNLLSQFSLDPCDSSIVEVIARLTSEPSYGIVSEPFSIILEQCGRCKISQSLRPHSRISDNVLIDLKTKTFESSFLQRFTAALRTEWIKFAEDEQLINASVKELFLDPGYKKSLTQVGGLYKFH